MFEFLFFFFLFLFLFLLSWDFFLFIFEWLIFLVYASFRYGLFFNNSKNSIYLHFEFSFETFFVLTIYCRINLLYFFIFYLIVSITFSYLSAIFSSSDFRLINLIIYSGIANTTLAVLPFFIFFDIGHNFSNFYLYIFVYCVSSIGFFSLFDFFYKEDTNKRYV